MIAPGDDPMTGLQIKLERQHFDLNQRPSLLVKTLESQTIYCFVRDEIKPDDQTTI